MSKPSNVNHAACQTRIDQITGTRDGRPLVLLDWAPDRFRWYPHRLGSDPIGYTYPSFCNARPLASPDRWALWARNEPEQYATLWEAGRYVRHKGFVWDVKGLCPSERYTELHVHALHDTDCCPCDGYECKCDNHCWGKYAQPNEPLFDWIRMTAWEALRDPDVKPTDDIRFFEAPHAQAELVTEAADKQAKQQLEHDEFSNEMRDHWLRQPVSVGFRQTESGLYVID